MTTSWTRQHTLASPVEFEGVGLHSGEHSHVLLRPAPAGTGRVFVRSDLPGEPSVTVSDVAFDCPPGRTVLSRDGVSVETIEHLLAALSGLGVDNVRVEVTGTEPPAYDGSARCFADAIVEAGLEVQDAPREAYVIEEPVVAEAGGAQVVALPARTEKPRDALSQLAYSLSYDGSSLASGWLEITLTQEAFLAEIAPARTFCMARDVDDLLRTGMGKGATHENTLVIKDDRVVDNELRFEDEPVRHKLLDLMGDLALLGIPVVGRVVGFRSGHTVNRRLARQIGRAARRRRLDDLFSEPVMDIRQIESILPHRYPFLLVDRVVELEPETRIVAAKNVTWNEEFFLGHFPSSPVMPGVLQVEALAQAAGLLLSRYVRVGKKMAALVGLDDVKMRRPVVPGDRLLLNVEVKRLRKTLGICVGKATVGGETATEATLLFGLIREGAVESS